MAAALAPPPSAVAPRAGGRPPRSPLKCQVRTPLRFLPDVPPPTSARAFSEAAWVRQRAPTRVRATRAAGGAEPSPISLGFSKKVNLDPSQNQRRTLPLWKENPIENPVLHGSETHHIPQDQQLACLSNSVASQTRSSCCHSKNLVCGPNRKREEQSSSFFTGKQNKTNAVRCPWSLLPSCPASEVQDKLDLRLVLNCVHLRGQDSPQPSSEIH
ncbi:uncharacterized protein LOC123794173 isoform X2 [Ursus americanus]|uniref:uncharacterized protein LOC123794173 isoform X2 n=1 Tax=Ursus americanus TaxID=9643 RepID=UPI001E67B5B8|nr:uncharacterized protein LOC123794173 isoform X2 [Ursus americanus]